MNTLKTERRDLAEKAKRLRREGFVTGSIFGHQIEGSIPVKIARSEAEKVLRAHGKGSRLMLELDGKSYPVLIKEIQYNALKGQYDEVDFQALVGDEMVRSVAEVQLHNHDKLQEGVLQLELKEISYSALPDDLIEKIVIDVAEMKVGDTVTVADLEISRNPKIHLHTDPAAVVMTVTPVNAQHVQDTQTPEPSGEAEAAE